MTEIEFLKQLLPEVSQLLWTRYARRDRLRPVCKSDDGEMVTQVDSEAQEMIVSRLAAEFPGDAVVAEEGDRRRLPAEPPGRCWVIDPLDGTHNFIRGVLPVFGTSVAFVADGEPVVGGIALPASGDLFLAEAGAGAYRNDERLAASEMASMGQANAIVEFCRLASRRRALSVGRRILEQAREVRGPGAAVVALCSVASGQGDLFIHPNLEPWDYAAGMLMVAEAGGTVSRLDGRAVRMFDGAKDLLATNGPLHAEALALVGPM